MPSFKLFRRFIWEGITLLALSLLVLVLGCTVAFAQTRAVGGVVRISTQSGSNLELYRGSYALVIGVSKYTAGWPILESVPREVSRVSATLHKLGFKVTQVLDPDAERLEQAFDDFIGNYGYQKQNRLLFFFSGHGYSPQGSNKGFLVPTDAPDPGRNRIGFKRKALPMTQVLAWAREMDAKHSLFLFDSCFSGTVFKAKSRPAPRHISIKTAHPVRQFISAGSANQEVPAKSVFAPSLIRGLEGEADRSPKDGYVSGSELGEYLLEKVTYYNPSQTPQYGKIRDPELDQGDFVFVLGNRVPPPPPPPAGGMSSEEVLLVNVDPRVVHAKLGEAGFDPGLFNPNDYTAMHRAVREFQNSQGLPADGKLGPQTWSALQLAASGQTAPPPEPPVPTSGTADLHVTTEPGEAVIYLDGQRKGRAPQTFQMIPAGKHRLEARKGYMVAKQEVPLARDDLKRVHLKLEHEKGDLRLFSQPSGALLSVDGKQYNATPVRIKGLKAGTHQVVLSKTQGRDYYEYKGELLIKPGSNRRTLQLVKSQIPQRITDRLGMKFVRIPAGSFMMGSNNGDSDEHPQHRVSISKPFYLQTTEVTQGQWRSVMGNNPSGFKGDDLPVERVSWNAVQEFIVKLNAKEGGNKYRLPTESEWEYAARAGSTTAYCFGDDEGRLGDYAWYDKNSGSKTHPVGQKKPNSWGLYDLHGNVWEWVQDWYGDYSSGSSTDPSGASSGSYRVIRGGSWYLTARGCRSAFRLRVRSGRHEQRPGLPPGPRTLTFALLPSYPLQEAAAVRRRCSEA